MKYISDINTLNSHYTLVALGYLETPRARVLFIGNDTVNAKPWASVFTSNQ